MWEYGFHSNVSKKDKVQLRLEVHDICKKDEKQQQILKLLTMKMLETKLI